MAANRILFQRNNTTKEPTLNQDVHQDKQPIDASEYEQRRNNNNTFRQSTVDQEYNTINEYNNIATKHSFLLINRRYSLMNDDP